jgi:hypothetical protein
VRQVPGVAFLSRLSALALRARSESRDPSSPPPLRGRNIQSTPHLFRQSRCGGKC